MSETNKNNEKKSKSEELNPLLLILGISTGVFFTVFLICSYFGNSNYPKGKKTLKSIKNPDNSVSPSMPQIDIPTTINIIPVQPSKGRGRN